MKLLFLDGEMREPIHFPSFILFEFRVLSCPSDFLIIATPLMACSSVMMRGGASLTV